MDLTRRELPYVKQKMNFREQQKGKAAVPNAGITAGAYARTQRMPKLAVMAVFSRQHLACCCLQDGLAEQVCSRLRVRTALA